MSRTFAEVSRDIKMAHSKVEMPGRKDEPKWNKAKEQVRKEYPEVSESNDKFWKIVQKIYESMGGK